MSTLQRNIPIAQPSYAQRLLLDVPEWRSGDTARTRSGDEGVVRSITDGYAWVEFDHNGCEFNARIPLERLTKIDPAVVAAREVLRQESQLVGGYVVETACGVCDAPQWGHVMLEVVLLTVAGYVRSCNCDVPRPVTERAFLVGAATANNREPAA